MNDAERKKMVAELRRRDYEALIQIALDMAAADHRTPEQAERDEEPLQIAGNALDIESLPKALVEFRFAWFVKRGLESK